MADIFDVVADATRRDLLNVLREQYETGSGEISVGVLVERLGLSQPTVSKHLKVLRDHGLVSVREDGQHRYYRLDAAPLDSIEEWLVPFLPGGAEAASDGGSGDAGSTVFSAWSGADVGDTIGRRIAEGSHQARTVIHDASDLMHDASGAVVEKLPTAVRRRLFRDR